MFAIATLCVLGAVALLLLVAWLTVRAMGAKDQGFREFDQ